MGLNVRQLFEHLVLAQGFTRDNIDTLAKVLMEFSAVARKRGVTRALDAIIQTNSQDLLWGADPLIESQYDTVCHIILNKNVAYWLGLIAWAISPPLIEIFLKNF